MNNFLLLLLYSANLLALVRSRRASYIDQALSEGGGLAVALLGKWLLFCVGYGTGTGTEIDCL